MTAQSAPTTAAVANKEAKGHEGDLRIVQHLNQSQLAKRWSVSLKTLERWRWRGQGPPYIKLVGRVLYRLEDIVEYERQRLRLPQTSGVPKKLSKTGR